MPAYEIISGAAIAFGALLLIIPGFAYWYFGFFIYISNNKKIYFWKNIEKFKQSKKGEKDFIEGEFEDIEDDNDRKI